MDPERLKEIIRDLYQIAFCSFCDGTTKTVLGCDECRKSTLEITDEEVKEIFKEQ